MIFQKNIIALLFVGAIVPLYAQIDAKFATNKKCEACHLDQSRKWETSRHAHSHYTKNDLYNKTLEYIVRRDPSKIKEQVIVECAKCHNPRIDKRTFHDVDKLEVLLNIDAQKVHHTLNNANMRNGVNCIVCHNVKAIHLDKNGSKRGFEAVEFGEQGVMYGPFKDSFSTYHKTVYQPILVEDPNRLCFVCHYSDHNDHGVMVYETGREYDGTKSDIRCIECHMSAQKDGFASNYDGKGGRVKRRVRDHLFASIDNSEMYRKYIHTEGAIRGNDLVVTIRNDAPHRIPTGYGLRQIDLDVSFFGNNGKLLSKANKRFGVRWLDAQGKPTIPHLAVKKGEDTRIGPKQTVTVRFPIPKGTKRINYKLLYRQVNPDLAKAMGVKDPFFTHEYILENGLLDINR
ncbi:multiheme c-type cytochrome [Nitratifractor sp.]